MLPARTPTQTVCAATAEGLPSRTPASLSALTSGSLGERVREAVHVAGRAVVDDGDSGRSRHRSVSPFSGTDLKSIRPRLPSRHGWYADTPRAGSGQPTEGGRRGGGPAEACLTWDRFGSAWE